MSTQPHHDDDQAKKPDSAAKKPESPATPPIPNMSLDEPHKPFAMDEVIEAEEVPVVKGAPESAVEEFDISDADVIEDVAEVEPVEVTSDVVMADDAVDVTGSSMAPAHSDVVISATGSAVQPQPERRAETPPEPVAAAPTSDVDLAKMFDEAPSSGTKGAKAVATPSEPEDDLWSKLGDASSHPPEEAAGQARSGATLEAAAADEIAHAVPTPDGIGEPIVIDEAVAETVHAPDALAQEAAEEIAAAPESAEIAADEAFEEMAEAAPVSDAHKPAEVAEEIVHAAPESAVLAAHEAEKVVETPSAVDVADEEVLTDEAIAEAAPASEMISDEVAEEVVEDAEEVSSATLKAEAVLVDEVDEAAEVASAAEVFDDVEEAEPVSAVAEDEVLDADSAVRTAPPSASGRTAHFDKTVAFEPPSSSARKTDDDILVTEEEIEGADEASAVDLGEMQGRKGSSVTGIDKVAEALESGVDLGAEEVEPAGKKTVGSVEFDELLDDEMDDHGKGMKAVGRLDDEPTEVDGEAIDDALPVDADAASSGKKGTKPAKTKATGDDIDLADLFGEDDVAEAADAEAAVAFDEEMGTADEAEAEAAEALADEEGGQPTKKAKKGFKTVLEGEDEEAQAAGDDEDEAGARKKKDKKDKELATVAAAPRQPSGALRIVIGMFVAVLLIVCGAGAVWFFAPDEIIKVARMSGNVTPPPAPPKVQPAAKTSLEIAQAAIGKGDFKVAITQLADASQPDELSARGEATWLAYYKEQADKKEAVDASAPAVKKALDDLTKAKNDILVAQINTAIRAKGLNDQLQKAVADRDAVKKQLELAKTDKDNSEKLVDAVADALVKGKFIADKANFDVAALGKILKNFGDDKTVLIAINKILDKEVKKSGEEGVNEILKLKQGLADNVAAVDKVLADEKTKDKGAKGVLEIVAARNKTAKDRDELAKTVAEAFKEFVDGKIVPADADPGKQLVQGAKLARQRAESPLSIPLAQLGLSLGGIGSGTSKTVEQAFDMAKLVSELSYFRTREPFVETPQQKMNTYITLLQDRRQSDAKTLAAINREADWILSPEAKADAESHGKARLVQGLAARNQEKFTEAKTALSDSVKIAQAQPKAGVWSQFARKALEELTDPRVYYIPRIERFRSEENPAEALAEANSALKAMPNEASLYAERGLVRLDLIKGKGAKADDAVKKDIRADADAAKKDDKLASESAYIIGLLEEELQNWPEAEKSFRAAIKLSEDGKALPDDAGKYRVALTRILLRDRPEGAAAPAPAPVEKKKDAKGAAIEPSERVIVLHPWTPLIVSTLIAQEPLDQLESPETLARLKEAIDEANKLIASKNPKLKGEGYLARGKALSRLGNRTEGLKAYSDGLKLIYPGIKTAELKELIDSHPAFQQPDVSNTPNPVMAERHFGEGIHLYWSKKYPEAEAQFRQALRFFDRDARYQYYLGLALLAQRTRPKRDAAVYAFEQGAKIEARSASTNPLVVREVNASLERIQGELRQYINTYRYQATPGSEPAPNVPPK